MRRIIAVIISLIFISCGNKKTVISNPDECKVTETSSEEIEKQYISFIADCDFCKNEFKNFNQIKNGILFYKWEEGIGSNNFLIINSDEDFTASRKAIGFNKKIDFTLEDKKNLRSIMEVLKKGNYYQSCVRLDGHSSLYVLEVRCENEKIVQYFSPFTYPYNVETSDNNLYLTKKILDIVINNFYK